LCDVKYTIFIIIGTVQLKREQKYRVITITEVVAGSLLKKGKRKEKKAT